MRAGKAWVLIAAIAVAALAWGWTVDGESVPSRPSDRTVVVNPTWYESVPLDPASATSAYLDRIPPQMRAIGERYSDTRLKAFGLRLVTLLIATALICYSGLAAHMRDLAARMLSRRTAIDAAVALQYFVALYGLSLPAAIYADFVRPHRFGFSEQTFATWLANDLVNWAVLTLFYLVGVMLLYAFMRRRPTQWVAWTVAVYVVLRALYTLLAPDVIEPLTNDVRPLNEGPQRELILALARANGVHNAAVVVSDASAQSRIANAHVSGFGRTTRISVDDTALQQADEASLAFLIAHEIGHFVLDHGVAWIVSDSLLMACGFVVIAVVMRTLVRRFGPRWRMAGMADIATLPVFWGLFLLWAYLSLPASNAISRVYERQADLFGLNASQSPHGMAEFMIHDADRTRLYPLAIEYALFYDHPSDAERVAAAMAWRAERARLRP